jgi:uncharacterized membrane protein
VKGILRFLKTTLLGGALVVLPAWLAVLLFVKAVMKVELLVQPLVKLMPDGLVHPRVVAVALMVVACFFVGALVRTAFGQRAKGLVEDRVLEKVPGYTTLRGIAKQLGDLEENHGFKPALVEIEEALAPCFIVETHEGDLFTVFIPSAPTPAAGTILIVDGARVHPVAVPVATMFRCVTKWGTGTGELLAAREKKTAFV